MHKVKTPLFVKLLLYENDSIDLFDISNLKYCLAKIYHIEKTNDFNENFFQLLDPKHVRLKRGHTV